MLHWKWQRFWKKWGSRNCPLKMNGLYLPTCYFYATWLLIKDVASLDESRAWVRTGATGAWHPPKLKTLHLAPADFEVLNSNWHPQSSFYVTSRTLSFKFLTQALGGKKTSLAYQLVLKFMYRISLINVLPWIMSPLE